MELGHFQPAALYDGVPFSLAEPAGVQMQKRVSINRRFLFFEATIVRIAVFFAVAMGGIVGY